MEKEFEESFEKVYDLISFDAKSKLQKAKKNLSIYIGCIVAAMIAIIVVMYILKREQYVINGMIVLEVAILLFFLIKARILYRKKFKEVVISTLVKGYNENLSYDTKSNLNSAEYKTSDFDRGYDDFYSEDGITGKLLDSCRINMAEIATSIVHKYKDNGQTKEDRQVTYRGLYGVAVINKKLATEISVLNDSHIKKFSKERIEVDSAEFEEYYDLLTREKVLALRIFTSELIEKYNDIRKLEKNKFPFELRIRDNMIFFRYKCGQLFEPGIIGNNLSKEKIKKYYKLIYYPLEVVKSTAENMVYVSEADQQF